MGRLLDKNSRMTVLRDWDLRLDADDVLLGQGADPQAVRARRPALVETAERALAEGTPLLKTAVLYRQVEVELVRHERISLAGGNVLTGPLVAQHLAPARRVVAALCTIGEALETRVEEAFALDMTYGLALDGFGSAAVDLLAMEACHLFEKEAATQGWQATTPLFPGMVGWPVGDGQQQVFQLLDASRVGVELLPSGMMMPKKSVSLVVGLGPDVRSMGRACDYCSMNETCRYKEQDA